MLSSKGSKPAGFIVSFVAFDGPLRPITFWRGAGKFAKKDVQLARTGAPRT